VRRHLASRPRGPIPWHPFLFAAVIVVTVWLDAAISPYGIIRSLLVALGAAGVLMLVLALVLRSLQLGGLAATIIIWVLWSKQLLEVASNALDRLGVFALLWLAAIVVVALLGIRLLARTTRHWTLTSFTGFLNRGAGLLLAASLLLGIVSGKLPALAEDLDQGVTLRQWAANGGSGPAPETPDIYAVLLDGYPRADVLEHAFGIDNSAFLDALHDRGFDISELAHSDYLWTHVSVPSALNMAYIEQIPTLVDVVAERAPQQPRLRHAITDNAVFDFVRERGYDTVAVASGFEEVTARRADVLVDGGQMSEFEVSLLASTFAGDLVSLLAPDLASGQHRDRILDNLRVLPEIAALRDRPPAFVFAHVPAPHQPTVFGENGEPVAVPITEAFYGDSPMERDEDPQEFADRYRAQLPYLNQQILAAIDGILAESSVPPIIVLFADHGSASRTDWNATNPYETEPSILLERTGILVAARTPERASVYPEDVSPVDLFRLLFDAYFGTELGRAEPPGGGEIAPVDASVLETAP
jgi:hypothetical protein